ncbi:MAG: YcgL domain-containing protein [Gammaproteobacteria bacterium]|nr:YcgL domain-containing protein [Gammaproteobacteria bacterium]
MKTVIFRCSKKQEMYLYVPYKGDEDALLKDLPEDLIKLTGRLDKTMELELSPDRKLARVDVGEVIVALEAKGFYLQMPPSELLHRDASSLENYSDGF